VSLFHELVLFWVSDTANAEKSPTENVPEENACPARCLGKIPDPQNSPSFPLDRATPPAKKGGCCKPAKLQGKNPRKSAQNGKQSFKSVFFIRVDTFFTSPKNTFVRLPKGAFYGLI